MLCKGMGGGKLVQWQSEMVHERTGSRFFHEAATNVLLHVWLTAGSDAVKHRDVDHHYIVCIRPCIAHHFAGLSVSSGSGFRAAFFPPPNTPCNPSRTLLTVFSTAGFSVCVRTCASLRVRSAPASC